MEKVRKGKTLSEETLAYMKENKVPDWYLSLIHILLMENEVKLNIIGDISKLPQKTIKACLDVCELTKNNDKLVLNMAINYGGRMEIVKADVYKRQCKNRCAITWCSFDFIKLFNNCFI